MFRRTLCIMFTLVCHSYGQNAQSVNAEESRVGFLYGQDHVFTLTAPAGWVLDNASGASQGLHAVFYPKGGSWQSSKAVMYGNGHSKDLAADETIQQFMAYDSSQFAESTPSLHIANAPSIAISAGRNAFVRTFEYSQFEIIAYIDEPKIVAMIVLTARTKADFQEAYGAFQELVKSYVYLGDNQLKKVTDFDIALKTAEENLNAPNGQDYDATIGKWAGKWLSQEIQVYTSGVDSTDLASFTLLVCVGSHGRAQEVLSRPTTIVAQRMESVFRAVSYPMPPAESWWVKVDIKFNIGE